MSDSTARFKKLKYALIALNEGTEGVSLPTPKCVRVTQEPIEGQYYMSAADVIEAINGCSHNAACTQWQRTYAVFKANLSPFMVLGHDGTGTRYIPLLSLTGVLRLLMLLSGKAAKYYRLGIADALVYKLAQHGGGLGPAFELNEEQRQLMQSMAKVDVGRMEVRRKRRLTAQAQPAAAAAAAPADVPGEGTREWGYCYLATNRSLHASLHKIGATTWMPWERITGMSTASVDEDFELVACFACRYPFDFERELHMYFASTRVYGDGKEFFNAPRAELLAYFNQMTLASLMGLVPPSFPPLSGCVRGWGYCFLAWNPCLPAGLHRVGATRGMPYDRLVALSCTNVPTPYQMLACFACWDPFEAIQRIEKHFTHAVEQPSRREFFIDAPRVALMELFDKMAMEALPGVHSATAAAMGRGQPRRSAQEGMHSEVTMLRRQVEGLRTALSAAMTLLSTSRGTSTGV